MGMLYIVRFKDMFKVGVSGNIKRPYRFATKIYSAYEPNLKQSYILLYYDRKILFKIEAYIKKIFFDYKINFNAEQKLDGQTEFFSNDCLSDVIEYMKAQLEIYGNTKDLAKKMTLIKGISRTQYFRGSTIPYIDQATTIIDTLYDNSDNFSVDIFQTNNIYNVIIDFKKTLKEIPPLEAFTYNSKKCDWSDYTIRDLVKEWGLNRWRIAISKTAFSILFHRDVIEFLQKLFALLRLEGACEMILLNLKISLDADNYRLRRA